MIKLSEETRRSGQTTGGLLKVLGEAITQPNVEIFYIDHAISQTSGLISHSIQRQCKQTLEGLIFSLGLKKIEVNLYSDGRLSVKSKWEPIFVGDDGHMYKRIT